MYSTLLLQPSNSLKGSFFILAKGWLAKPKLKDIWDHQDIHLGHSISKRGGFWIWYILEFSESDSGFHRVKTKEPPGSEGRERTHMQKRENGIEWEEL